MGVLGAMDLWVFGFPDGVEAWAWTKAFLVPILIGLSIFGETYVSLLF
jgi:hypothetical protein